MRKNLDISEEAVEALTIQAVKEKTVFKLKAEQILEDAAKPFKGVVIRSRLSPGDKLICWAKGAGYGDTFTVQDPMYDGEMILQCDKYDSWASLKDVDLTEFDYA